MYIYNNNNNNKCILSSRTLKSFPFGLFEFTIAFRPVTHCCRRVDASRWRHCATAWAAATAAASWLVGSERVKQRSELFSRAGGRESAGPEALGYGKLRLTHCELTVNTPLPSLHANVTLPSANQLNRGGSFRTVGSWLSPVHSGSPLFYY